MWLIRKNSVRSYSMIIINFKNYKHGRESLALAKKIQRFLPKAIVSVSSTDIFLVSKNTKLSVFAQHVDFLDSDRATGFLTAEAVKSAGAKGTLVNHSEHPLKSEEVKRIVQMANEKNLKVILCVPTIKQAKKFLHLKPWAMAFEDKKLVGTKKSITKYRKRKVKKFAKILGKTEIISLCGAGIHSAKDVKAAKEFGCKGVLIASAIANSRDPGKFLKALGKV